MFSFLQAFGLYENQLDRIVSAITRLLDNPPLSLANSGTSSFENFKQTLKSAAVLIGTGWSHPCSDNFGCSVSHHSQFLESKCRKMMKVIGF